MYNDVKLEKGLYNLSGKSFVQALEAVDPTSAYEGTPLAKLDAYERQLKRFDIKVSGDCCDTVEKFFATTESAVLFPEFLRRSIKKGFDQAILGDIVAAESKCDCNQYIGCLLDDSAAYTTTSEGAELPAASVTESTSATTLLKYGRIINASYEAVRQQRLDCFCSYADKYRNKACKFDYVKCGFNTFKRCYTDYLCNTYLCGSYITLRRVQQF